MWSPVAIDNRYGHFTRLPSTWSHLLKEGESVNLRDVYYTRLGSKGRWYRLDLVGGATWPLGLPFYQSWPVFKSRPKPLAVMGLA